MTRRFAAVALLCLLFVLPACAMNRGSDQTDKSGYVAPGAVSPGSAAPLAPGRTAERGGRVEVIGTLRRDGAGTWVVVEAVPAQAASGRVIAVIINPAMLAKLTSLENFYVRVTGTAAQGIATDKTGVGMVADTVTKLSTQ